MGNSRLVSYVRYSPFHSGRRTHAIDRITPHCVVGQCGIEALGNLFSQPGRNASSNYGIDRDGRVGLFVDEDCVSWCSGGELLTEAVPNDRRAVTIECASDSSAPWAFRPAVYERLAELCADVCRRNGKTKLKWLEDRDAALAYEPKADEMLLTVHRWFANKACPGDWLMARMGDLAGRVTEMLGEESTAANAAPGGANDDPAPVGNAVPGGTNDESAPVGADAPGGPQPWYASAMAWAKDAGLIRDGRPEDPVTRAELATVLYRMAGPEGLRERIDL